MTPTKKQIEYYIECADLEMGTNCEEEWVEEVRKHLRQWVLESVQGFAVASQFVAPSPEKKAWKIYGAGGGQFSGGGSGGVNSKN